MAVWRIRSLHLPRTESRYLVGRMTYGVVWDQVYGMQRSRAWCGTPPILGVVNMVGTRNFTCYMGAL